MWKWIRRAYYVLACIAFSWQLAQLLIFLHPVVAGIVGIAVTTTSAMWIGHSRSHVINSDEPMDANFSWKFLLFICWVAAILNMITTAVSIWTLASAIALWSSVIMAPVFEEAFFRDWLWNRITALSSRTELSETQGNVIAFGITTMLFWMIHIPSWGWQKTFLLLPTCILLGVSRLRTRGVFTSTAAHAVFNLTNYLLLL